MGEGLLSLMRRGDAYQVRYASTNPYAPDPPPASYRDTATLTAVLRRWGIDVWSIQQAIATVRSGRVAVLPVHVTAAQFQAAFPSHRAPRVSLGATDAGGQTPPPPPHARMRCDHFSLAIDVIDRVPDLRVAGAYAKEQLRNRQIDCQHYAYEHGIDKPEIDNWKWPY